ncbi:MAG: carotenoid 1,2-hydratase [Verrucomicrobiales bacterium]|nr:carotenoid 1,2-hydratase [Verrucomicrobiales bacterium]
MTTKRTRTRTVRTILDPFFTPGRIARPGARGVVLFLLAMAPVALAAADSLSGYAIPEPGVKFEFPRDHGSHPRFRVEWWYVTGHLWDEQARRYGFQATFFRTAAPHRLPEAAARGVASPNFGTDHLFLSHLALLDVASARFLHEERLHREGWAAGAATNTLHVWNGGSSLVLTQAVGLEQMHLRAAIRAEASWDLQLTAAKPLVVFGTNGVSRKGETSTAASHYLTFPRLDVSGRLTVAGTTRTVRGQAWMDHEFSSSQLSAGQSGWDWVSVQLAEGREIMAYRMRRKDGTTDPFSTLAWVGRDGHVIHQPAGAFELMPLARWKSPGSGAEYPLGLALRAQDPETGTAVEYRLIPLARDQELPGRIGDVPYWEGACRVEDVVGREVGSAFVELTGYAGDLAGRLR